MNAVDWLSKNAPGFAELPELDRETISDFALLWSFFESTAMGTSASAKSIQHLAKSWFDSGKLNGNPFDGPLSYFRDRYFTKTNETEYFKGLMLRANDNESMVRDVLSGKSDEPVECAAGLFIVIYRLRNNLFHGAKWAYGIKGQHGNFMNANLALIAALELGL